MLRVVRADTGTALADAMADALAIPPADPLATEEVVVHTRGMERWLSQHLSRRLGVGADGTTSGDGVCANVAFPFPIDIVRRTIRAVGGPDPRDSAWAPDRLVWPLMALADDGLGPWAAPLAHRLAADPDDRFDVLRGVADLLDRYAAHRPDLVLRWLDGDDVGADGQPLGPADAWQPQLLRHLRTAVGQPTLVEQIVSAITALDEGDGPLPGLPPRLGLFGFTALPAAHLAVLVAVARRVDLTLYLLHPSHALWASRAGVAGQVSPDGFPVLPARADQVVPPPQNRLLRSWGRDAAELQLVVSTVAGPAVTGAAVTDIAVADATGAGRPPATGPQAADTAADPATLLGRIQAAVRADAPTAPGVAMTADDTSVQVHACHGRARQVQVLRDEILRLMAADPTLQPRDIVVMCPDVEAFAPLVTAHLSVPPDDPDGRPDLRVRLADRALRQVNPMLRVIDDLLGLASDRLTATRLLDLAGADPVRRRFGLNVDALESLEGWALRSGMRWGLDVADRAQVGVAEPANTIDAGLSRILLGVAVADEEDRIVGGITPLDDVAGGDVALAGRLAELVARLGRVLAGLRDPKPLDAWVAVLTDAADLLMRAPTDDPWQRTQLTTLLDDVAADAAGSTVQVSLVEVRALLAERLKGQPSWANHRTGDLTVCTLVPMRSVPHRVVCLLGMDDEVFPRRPHARGDDLIARHPRVGDRDARTEDRQLLLDAVMSASDAVVVTFAGTDERTGQPRPPCVPIAELLRALDVMAPGAADAVTTSHPLHGHDPQAFAPDRPGFDAQVHRAAIARRRPPQIPDDGLPVPGPVTADAVDVDHLVAFVRDPARHFYRWTVGAWIPDDPQLPDSQVPLVSYGLREWALGDALLCDGAIDDPDRTDAVIAAVRGRGDLPPGPLGEDGIAKACAGARSIADHCTRLDLPLTAGSRRRIDTRVGGRQLVGTIDGIHATKLVTVTYSSLKAKQIIPVWVRFLALNAADPQTPWEGWIAGRHETNKDGRRKAPHAVRFRLLDPTAEHRGRIARTHLADLLGLHDDGLREPLVVPPLTAAAYAIERLIRRQPVAQADDKAALRWDHDDHGFDNEADMAAHVLRFGDSVPYRVLTAAPARPQDTLPDRDPEPHCFGGLALRLWAPLLRSIEVGRA